MFACIPATAVLCTHMIVVYSPKHEVIKLGFRICQCSMHYKKIAIFFLFVFNAPAYSMVRYRSSNFCLSIRQLLSQLISQYLW